MISKITLLTLFACLGALTKSQKIESVERLEMIKKYMLDALVYFHDFTNGLMQSTKSLTTLWNNQNKTLNKILQSIEYLGITTEASDFVKAYASTIHRLPFEGIIDLDLVNYEINALSKSYQQELKDVDVLFYDLLEFNKMIFHVTVEIRDTNLTMSQVDMLFQNLTQSISYLRIKIRQLLVNDDFCKSKKLRSGPLAWLLSSELNCWGYCNSSVRNAARITWFQANASEEDCSKDLNNLKLLTNDVLLPKHSWAAIFSESMKSQNDFTWKHGLYYERSDFLNNYFNQHRTMFEDFQKDILRLALVITADINKYLKFIHFLPTNPGFDSPQARDVLIQCRQCMNGNMTFACALNETGTLIDCSYSCGYAALTNKTERVQLKGCLSATELKYYPMETSFQETIVTYFNDEVRNIKLYGK